MATTNYPIAFRNAGALTAGLTPVWSALYKLSDGTSVADPNTVAPITALGGGLYKIAYDPESANGELAGIIDGTATITSASDRYIDICLAADSSRATRLDAAMSSRASQASLDTVDDFLDTEIAAIKAKTDNLPASPAAVGSAMTLADGAITAAKISSGAIDADALTSDAVAEIADGVWDEALSGHSAAGSTGEALTKAAVGASFAVLGMKLVIDGQDCDCETLPRLSVRKGDDRDVVLWVVDGDGDHLPIPSSVTPTLVDATGGDVDSAELIDIKASIGYLKVRVIIPSTGTMPASLMLLFDGGAGATWTWEVLLTVL